MYIYIICVLYLYCIIGMYVCMYVCVYIYILAYMHICIYVHMYIYIYICIWVVFYCNIFCTLVFILYTLYIYIYIYIYFSTYIYICIFATCMCIYIYICIHFLNMHYVQYNWTPKYCMFKWLMTIMTSLQRQQGCWLVKGIIHKWHLKFEVGDCNRSRYLYACISTIYFLNSLKSGPTKMNRDSASRVGGKGCLVRLGWLVLKG